VRSLQLSLKLRSLTSVTTSEVHTVTRFEVITDITRLEGITVVTRLEVLTGITRFEVLTLVTRCEVYIVVTPEAVERQECCTPAFSQL
jgi:hypothetical protein